ncbi:16S rRNA (cytosine(967)-C(5))-methyltransferase RsmB [Jeotgalibacillus proteolyticus]|uniref:16S rRNA (cytosine(967)-C(5))-methyltransferase n=1 Tax=Jeotgalibacillus proteolyticus TaxID=2082395 RepID=A0A2S5GGR0_9BACL|nr:16S rRNA (cytosine(967)-C(5))-methyltransferase RsmB [Jeotgalibacillus proteolyticus]PPA72101.1 16S rRNA (cytosine(967)-C(5))-methyltransferase [Jeotgalibacillus proteolyticus]
MSNTTPREAALSILDQIDKNQSYSNLLLNHAINNFHLKGPDVGLLTELTYGTIQRKLTLDFYLAPFIKKKVEAWVRNLLRMSLYQMIYLDRVPERAAIHEAVEIAKKKGHKGIAGLVNGVLRSIQREGLPALDEIKDPIERVSIETSHPYWLVDRWVKQYGIDKTREMCQTNLLAPVQTARVNTLLTTRDEVLSKLEREGVEAQPSHIIPEGISITRGNIAHTEAYKQGLLTIQDESSMLVAYALNPEPGEHILDMCAAPGGKTSHIAQKMKNKGSIIALDLHPHKIKLVEENAARLGITTIKGQALDARKAQEHFDEESFDRVLVDAPCSGLGVLRRKPDIKYAKKEQDLHSLAAIQISLLESAARMLKPGGTLVYSTCTVDHAENNQTVKHFLKENNQMKLAPLSALPEPVQPLAEDVLQVFPQDFGGDGFFIACFKKEDTRTT